jgi:5'(3')-deoxyribonucleotidase
MRLGIDLDGVVADFDRGWTSSYTAEFGVAPRQAVPEWDGLHRLTHFPDMAAFWDWMHTRGVFGRLDPIPGAVEGLTELAREHEIVIISAKDDAAIPDTLRWLAQLRIPTREIHFTGAKHTVACDVYLDDSPIVLPALVRHRPGALICRMVAPWNTPVPGTVDVTDWPGFLEAVARHADRSLVDR